MLAPSLAVVRAAVRPVLTTLVVALISVGGTIYAPANRPAGHGMDATGGFLVLVATAVVLVARVLPWVAFPAGLVATTAYYGLGYHTDSPYFIPLLVTGYLVAAPGARLRSIGFGVATAAAQGIAGLFGRSVDPGGGLVVPIVVIAGLGAGQVAAELRAASARRTREAHADEALRMVGEERLRIARELHDVVSHSISMINVQAGVAVHVMDAQPEQAREALIAIKAASREALGDLRSILGLLRGSEAEPRSPLGGLDQLPALVENVRRVGIDVTLKSEGEIGTLPAATQLVLYRVVQEALTNVVRHAPGASARIVLARRGGELVISVDDDGRVPVAAGLESRQGAGQGIAGMRERVGAAGGSLRAGPRPEGGFEVEARLPVEPAG